MNTKGEEKTAEEPEVVRGKNWDGAKENIKKNTLGLENTETRHRAFKWTELSSPSIQSTTVEYAFRFYLI